MNLSEEFRKETLEDNRVKRELLAVKQALAKTQESLDRAEKALSFIDAAEHAVLEPPTWLAPSKPRSSAATLMLALSDMHFDEVVNPEEVDGLNAYNRDIAITRLKKWAENVVKLARHHLAGITYDGVVVALLGDTFSGDIHEELTETNEDTMLGSTLFWSEQIAAAIDMLRTEFGKVHIAAVPGNHGRTTRKPRAKLRARTNFDWLIAKMIERHFKGIRQVSFDIPESADCLLNIYGQGHLLTHGDAAGGGQGIGGIYPPIMRMRARKAQRYLATNSSFVSLWMGHWHQYMPSPGLVINGSIKGYDEYAYMNSFSYELPQQALAVIVPEKGITFHAPVFCQDRKKEKW